MSRPRCLPLPHPLAALFDRAVDSLCAALSPSTTGHYRSTVQYHGYLAIPVGRGYPGSLSLH
jgi:hypothetical protein